MAPGHPNSLVKLFKIVGDYFLGVVVVDSTGAQISPAKSEEKTGTTNSYGLVVTNNTVQAFNPSQTCKEIHFCNYTGQTLKYGGSGIGAVRGAKVNNGGVLAIKQVTSSWTLYLFQNSGSDQTIEVVEFI